MKHLLLFIAVFIVLGSVSYAQQAEKQMKKETEYLLYLPKDKPGSDGYPLMLFYTDPEKEALTYKKSK
ncbi:hypothetical protein AB9P05_18175 [Roseivirga sp. BDSF3-8]|uniref:hypothetical protein n=1 Tax=Roseivirga sp. BDSF3-8 TaxID=3241598 RepID=UPI003531F079